MSLLAKKFTLMDIPKRIITGKLQPPADSLPLDSLPADSLKGALTQAKSYKVTVNQLGASGLQEIKSFIKSHIEEQSNTLELKVAEYLKSLEEDLRSSTLNEARGIVSRAFDQIFQDAESEALGALVQLVITELRAQEDCLRIECSPPSKSLLGDLPVTVNDEIPAGEFHLQTKNGSIVVDLEKVKRTLLEEISVG